MRFHSGGCRLDYNWIECVYPCLNAWLPFLSASPPLCARSPWRRQSIISLRTRTRTAAGDPLRPQWWPEFLYWTRWHGPSDWLLRVFSCPRRTRCSPLCPCTRRTPAKRSLPIGHSLSRQAENTRSHHGWLLFTLTVKLFSTWWNVWQIVLTDVLTNGLFPMDLTYLEE